MAVDSGPNEYPSAIMGRSMSTFTIEKLHEAMRLIDDLPPCPPSVKICPTSYWPTVQDGEETCRFPAHPIIQWAAKWLPVKPYVEAIYPKYRDADMMFDERTGRLFCSFDQADIVKRRFRAS